MAANPHHNRPSEVIYQIYPSSFMDSNGDGIGDLNGITQKLDHIKSLGADAIWISPFFLSPKGDAGDGGYAITDYRKIDPRYGTMEDFERLLDAAHKKGLRVYTDFVLCHTSNEHEWFKKSENREPGYEDRYVWRDAKLDGGHRQPPNNWLSVFGGSAWTYSEKRGQYYLRHFNSSQPALNLNEGHVEDASIAEMKFWLDKGVDGLRIDALPFAHHDKEFRDNHKRGVEWNVDDMWKHNWNCQDFTYSMCQPATEKFVEKVRRMMERDYAGQNKIALGEVVAGPWGGDGSMEQAAKYLHPENGLQTCYTQSLVQFYNQYPEAKRLRQMIEQNAGLSPDGGFCNNLGNHDFPRFATRMMGDAPYELHDTIIKQLMTLAVTLPGSFCMFQGEELGLTQAADTDLNGKRQDAVAIECRDGCRTPMPWEADAPNAGFSTHHDPYLPVPKSHLPLAVDVQESQSESMLHFTRRIIHQRKENEALLTGKTIVLKTKDPIVAFVRQTDKQTVLCSFNMSGKKVAFRPADLLDAQTMSKLKIPGDGWVHLEAYASSIRGLKPLTRGVELGMTAEPSPVNGNGNGVGNGTGNGQPHHKRSRIFAVDMLIGDSHMPEAGVAQAFEAVKRSDPDFQPGEKITIGKGLHEQMLAEAKAYQGGTVEKITAGGSTSCALGTLKGILGDEIDVSIMGLAGDDEYGRAVKTYLKDMGVRLITEQWPQGMKEKPETAISSIVNHEGAKISVLTYPGNGVEALHELLRKEENQRLLEKSVKNSDVVYLPESSISKFGLPFTNRLVEHRLHHKKELVIALPTRANFGHEDSDRFRQLIRNCNVVMGNDVEFCRIMDKEAGRPVPEAQMDRVIEAIQKEFGRNQLEEYGIPCSPEGQVAFITRGNYQPALLVTKDHVEEIPVAKVNKVHSMLGAGHATFAGFLTGYMKGLSHKQSAVLAMGLAAEKVSQPGPHPHLLDAEKALDHALLRGGPMRAIARAFEIDEMPEPHERIRSGGGAGSLPNH